MIKPSELATITANDTKSVAEFEEQIEKALKASPYFGIEIEYGCNVFLHDAPPARVWLHVLNKYIEAGWIVNPRPENRLFASPFPVEQGKPYPTFTIRAPTPQEIHAAEQHAAKK